jgi:hypothetical protein
MLEGGEKHSISHNQPDPTVKYKDMAVWVSTLKVLSLSLSHSAILGIFCIILLFI